MVTAEKLQELASWESTPASVEAINAALVQIWGEAGRPRPDFDGQRGDPSGVLRVRVANLLIFTTGEAEAGRARAVLAAMAGQHPVRSVLMLADPQSNDDSLGASLHIFCHPLLGRRVCFEQIQLSAAGRETRQLASVATQLLVHDLPTLLWWVGEPAFDRSEFLNLVDLADLILIDSGQFETEPEGLIQFAKAARTVSGEKSVADLNWNRLADWRELVAQFFDGADAWPSLESIHHVEIEVDCANNQSLGSAQALLMAGWLGSRLGWQKPEFTRNDDGLRVEMLNGSERVELRVVPATSTSTSDGCIAAIRIEAGAGASSARFALKASDDRTHGTAIAEFGDGRSSQRCFVLEQASEADLLSQELVALGREHALDEALEFAARLAAGLPDLT